MRSKGFLHTAAAASACLVVLGNVRFGVFYSVDTNRDPEAVEMPVGGNKQNGRVWKDTTLRLNLGKD